MRKTDVIIILGGGTDGTPNPNSYTKARLDGFVSMGKKFSGIPIIASGGWSASLDKKPKYTEAEVMRNYLVKNGVPPRLIYAEDRSRDTIGNAYYSKQIIKRHSLWKNILVVTSDVHIPRSRWLFGKIFGASYTIHYLGTHSQHYSVVKNQGIKKYERYIINTYVKLLATMKVKNGDDKAIMKILKKIHPTYSKNEKAQKMQREIIEKQKTFLGYARRSKLK
jgi:uncharacterized SAM-binding protein YcdF (DUF218 family)